MEPATVTVQLTPADHEAFTKFTLKGSICNWRGLIVFVIVAGLFGYSYFATDHSAPPDPALPSTSWKDTAITVLPIVILFPVVWWYLRRQQRKALKEQSEAGIFSPIQLRITDEGLQEESAIFSGITKWTAISNLGETEEHLFLMRTKQIGIVIPKRSFATREGQAIFVNQLKLHLERSRAAEPSVNR
jgi:hypothetical protein